MKVLCCVLPQLTHFYALAPIAWALRTAGHEVRVASTPGFTDAITRAGLTAVPLGHDPEPDPEDETPEAQEALDALRRGLPKPYDLAEFDPDRADWTEERAEAFEMMVTYAFGEDNEPLLDGAVEFARAWRPDLVLWEPFTYSGALAAHACGAAHGRVLFGTDFLGITHEWIREHVPEDHLTRWLTETAARHGLPYADHLRAGHFTLDQLPPSLAVSREAIATRFVPYGGAAVVPSWVTRRPERPRVALTLGTSATEYSGYTVNVADILTALSTMDIEVVATVADSERDALGTIPDNARVVSYVPLDALAATCTAAIHHGGFGTLATFSRHGVPQLVLPYDFDAPLLARKLAAQGTGLTVHSDVASGPAVRDALSKLLTDPAFRTRGTALREEIAALPGPNDLVAHLEQLAAKHRTP
ncbi:nucleotide disphospho-sugar-binding domain-containing protein [Amycolatopsis samaneae]|uniref:Nucleotide disphospho-sugar-binding domain-containing protein n=1 Tax=Amycolatopsis samaneae TaxID=664691 RepID=A0ABW5GFE7_9PSEU